MSYLKEHKVVCVKKLFNVCTAYEHPVEKDSSTEWKEGVNG